MAQRKKVIVYSIIPCPFCQRAKSLLVDQGVDFEEIIVDRADDQMREMLGRKSKMRTFPQIFHGEDLIGGYQELYEKFQREGGLSSLR